MPVQRSSGDTIVERWLLKLFVARVKSCAVATEGCRDLEERRCDEEGQEERKTEHDEWWGKKKERKEKRRSTSDAEYSQDQAKRC